MLGLKGRAEYVRNYSTIDVNCVTKPLESDYTLAELGLISAKGQSVPQYPANPTLGIGGSSSNPPKPLTGISIVRNLCAHFSCVLINLSFSFGL